MSSLYRSNTEALRARIDARRGELRALEKLADRAYAELLKIATRKNLDMPADAAVRVRVPVDASPLADDADHALLQKRADALDDALARLREQIETLKRDYKVLKKSARKERPSQEEASRELRKRAQRTRGLLIAGLLMSPTSLVLLALVLSKPFTARELLMVTLFRVAMWLDPYFRLKESWRHALLPGAAIDFLCAQALSTTMG